MTIIQIYLNILEMSYNQILQEKHNWSEKWDSKQVVPYAESSSEWVTYDNRDSIIKKVEIVKTKGLKGCFFWSSHQDDFGWFKLFE